MHKNKTSFLGKLHNSKINTISNKILYIVNIMRRIGASLWYSRHCRKYWHCQYIIMYSIEDRKGRRLPALPIIVFYLLSFALLGRILEKPVLFRQKLNQLLFH